MAQPPYKYIWYFDSRSGFSDGQSAPKLIGANGTGSNDGIGNAVSPDIEGYTYVNVSKHFSWTLNDERDEVPRVILKELTQTQTALLQRAKYFLGQSSDIGTAIGLAFTDVLDSYTGLYGTDDTGFYYDLPCLTGDYLKTGGNQFATGGDLKSMIKSGGEVASTLLGGADSKFGGAARKIANIAAEAPDMIGKFREAVTGGGAGYYTEQPQFYQHGGNARNYTVTFPLYNTGDYDDMIRNFQLAYMLVYQNLPNRESKQLILPPSIYEVTFPGVTYCPYAYMSSVDVKFIGSIHELTIPVPFEEITEVKNIRVTIPEAYEITLNIQELVGNTRNFMYFNVDRLVSTGVESIDANVQGET